MQRLRARISNVLSGGQASPALSRCCLIFGCQRSGTSITHEVLGRSDRIHVYPELHLDAHFWPYGQKNLDLRFRSTEEIDRLLAASNREVVVFKPLMESQYASELMERQRAKGIWIYRNFLDVADSAVARWGDSQKKVIDKIVEDDWGSLGWRIERMSRDTIHQLKKIWSPDLSAHEGACLFWWTRNRLFLEQNLFDKQRLMVLKYESMVSDPVQEFGRVFQFLDVPFEPEYVHGIHASSVAKKASLQIRGEIEELCRSCLQAIENC